MVHFTHCISVSKKGITNANIQGTWPGGSLQLIKPSCKKAQCCFSMSSAVCQHMKKQQTELATKQQHLCPMILNSAYTEHNCTAHSLSSWSENTTSYNRLAIMHLGAVLLYSCQETGYHSYPDLCTKHFFFMTRSEVALLHSDPCEGEKTDVRKPLPCVVSLATELWPTWTQEWTNATFNIFSVKKGQLCYK